ncbi:MAG: Rpn family recombination-promoting nuclease/putative transposase, partial [Crocosphaera sp.]
MIDHDRLFKELISTFFVEFIELFFPQVITYLDGTSVRFLDKEIFTDVTEGDRYETDLIAQVKFKNEPSFFLIHIEAQSSSQSNFNRRMFSYFARLHEKFALPIYPIVVFSYDYPQKEADSQYKVEFPDLEVLNFNYRVVQLNQLNWRDFINQPNPVASALMAKMKIAAQDRAKVKAQCLRLLVTLKLDPARMQLISGFIDTYLTLNPVEENIF